MPSTLTPQKILKAQTVWRNNPISFSQSFFKTKLWDKQIEVMESVRDNKRTAVKSGNTVGKSRDAAEIALWFLVSHYPSKVLTTAPTFTQIEKILWKEIAGLYNHSVVPIGGELNKTELKMNDKWFAMGLSTNEVNRFQGFHSPYLLVIIDEALGVESIIWEAIESLHPYRILAIGNPLSPDGNFFNCFSSELWNKITISCEECVVWQDKNGAIPGLVTREWINERKEEWGIDSPLYQARVLGEFPVEGTDILIPIKYVDRARNNSLSEDEEIEMRIVSGDIATKHGENFTAIMYRYGHTVASIDAFQNIPTTMAAVNIQHKYERKQAESIVIDSDGVGEGVGDILTQKKIGHYEFHGGYASKAMDSHRFKNLRSQFYWVIAKKFEKNLYDLTKLPQHIFDKLKNQLTSIKVRPPDGQGRIQIETKEDMKKRSLPSPDLADSLMMSEYAFFMGRQGDLKPYRYR